MPKIAIPYVPMPPTQNPNTKSRSLDTYLVSSVVTMASIRRWNPDVQLLFVTTEGPHEPWRSLLEKFGVEIQHAPFAHLPPPGFAKTFLGSLYLLDVLASIDADYLAIVDPDVFCVGALDDVLSPPGAIQALPVPSPRGTKINGLSPREADEIHLDWESRVKLTFTTAESSTEYPNHRRIILWTGWIKRGCIRLISGSGASALHDGRAHPKLCLGRCAGNAGRHLCSENMDCTQLPYRIR